ncbi:aldehyde dehydrogenase family protein [Amycolatopsis sp. CA-230715]|uniref:aldehyde dehydrogenase family protein n=1 Tax=Amycolatopsis sp. CA-230715 TaxID=2745196 RepID=UPI001C015B00|nr:aldehyde dehydrogenase family protein [Amycolatopsis sp. CA-230715]QWF78825.1 Aldehyde dehydrogenase, thermostable [Amycolatopsis sp. CA-230715]
MTRVVSTSPQRPADVVADCPATPAEQVTRTVAESLAAQREWARSAAADRAAALTAMADAVAGHRRELADLVIREVGKPSTEALGEVSRTVAILRYYAQQCFEPVGETYPRAGGLDFTVRRPHGVAGLITPWNFPLAIPVWKAAPALACGNAVVLKPAPAATGCALRLAELFAPHLPEGLFSVVPGLGDAGAALVGSADVVSFTGSGAVGRTVAVAAAERGVPAQCEMGGLNASIVLPDADPDRAAAQIAAAAMGFAGQKCTATKRILVVGDAANFADALVAKVEALGVGDPADEGVAVGPVIDEAARQRVLAAADGKVLTGGGSPGGDGWFASPTVVTGLGQDAPLNTTEVFGPICTLTGVSTVDEALRMANSGTYGLVTALYSNDLDAALSFVDQCESGMVKVNAPTSGVDFHLPFGGEKESGYGGREQGKAALRFYSSSRTVQLG